MTRRMFFFLLIIYTFCNPFFPTCLHAGEESQPWKTFEEFLPVLQLEFTEDLQTEQKSQYVFWPLWKPNASQELATEFPVSMRALKTRLENAGINETVTIEIGLEDTKANFPAASRVEPSRLSSEYIRLIAQLGTFSPGTEGRLVIPDTGTAYISNRELEQLKKDREAAKVALDVPQFCTLVIRDKNNDIKVRVKVECRFPLEETTLEFKRFKALLVREMFDKAEAHCEELKGELREKRFAMAAEAYFAKGDLDGAARCFDKAVDEIKAGGYNRLGAVYLAKKNYEKAVEFLSRGELNDIRARAYGLLADVYRDKGDNKKAKEFYDKAISDYESMVKSIHFTWSDFDNRDRRRCITERGLLRKSSEEIAREKRLDKLLKGSANYCKRLLDASFDFICDEVVTERFETARENKSVYFYRLTRIDGKVDEVRSLTKQTGRRIIRKGKDSKTEGYMIERVIFGPTAMLGKGWGDYFDYRIVGEEELNGQKAVILDVLPQQPPTVNSLFGQVWINEKDCSVMKISWNPKSTVGLQQDFQVNILERAKKYNGEPYILSILELNVEKRGLRFPGRCLIEESYIKPDGSKETRVKRTTEYKKYLFYSVGTEVTDEGLEEGLE
jgi:tetratricopeptide (TPR) repeat protein